jgi:hypothetical protein
MRTSPISSVMSETTKRLEIGPELWFRVIARTPIEARDSKGAIAQLGERLHGMQEVGGSIPPGSTTLRPSGFAWRSHEMHEGRSVVPGVARRAKTGFIRFAPFSACGANRPDPNLPLTSP